MQQQSPALRVIHGDGIKTQSSLDKVLELFLSQFDTPTTRKTYQGEIQRLFTWLGHENVDAVKTEHLLRYRAEKSHLSAASRHRILVTIRRFFEFAKKQNFIDKDPAQDIQLPRVHSSEPEILSQSEAELLLRIPDQRTRKGKRDLVILSLALCNGLRASEICGLNIGDLKKRYGRPAIRVQGKGNKERVLILSQTESNAIESYLKLRGDKDGLDAPLLLTVKSKPDRRITPKVVRLVVETICRKALINRRVHPHLLRHTCFSLELEAGADILKISKQAAHSSLSVTARYLHQIKGATDPAVDSNPLGGNHRNTKQILL